MEENSKELEVIQKGNSVFSTDESYKRALDVASKIAASDLIPSTYKGKPSNCIIALDVARQVRSSPLIVMQNLNIILGKPSWSSTYIAAANKARYKNIKVILTGDGLQRGCQVVAYDKRGEIIAEGVRVTMQMAVDEGWVAKTGSKWKTMPDLMLQYRANAFFGRIFCPDVLLGLQSEYEVYDVEDKNTIDVAPVSDPFAIKEKKPSECKEGPSGEIIDET
ncbi:MAG: hypothetical protein JRJ39_00065 [Deltaproteobacteria bacterium]|nr:hypothetical protein [Deltaproteobacteria bacterium]